MIDWHSHILPGMDDGSQNTAESSALLKMLSEQGVNTVIATPHFYANDESVDSFLARRSAAREELRGKIPDTVPEILLGAEVRYYPGISRMSDLKLLNIEGSKLVLLEMSVSKWTEYTVREVIELAGSRDLTVVLAHVERYLPLQIRGTWERLLESGVLMQVNADFFIEFGTRRKAMSLLGDGYIHFVGSDCHNTSSRPPHIGKAFENIKKKLGDGFISQMNEYGYSVLRKK